MTSNRPYLIRAIYEWLLDNEKTPYIMVDATAPEIQVPHQYVEDGKIVLNIEPRAVAGLMIGNRVLDFKARFSGVSYHLVIPIAAVKAIYALENGRGMIFNEEDEGDEGSTGDTDLTPAPTVMAPKSSGKKPTLKIVK